MRKYIWAAIIIIFLGGSAYLALNSTKVLVSSRAGAITENQYMSSVTATSAGQQLFVSMVMNKSLEHSYGKQVSSTDVDKAYQLQRVQYGSQWSAFLSQQGISTSQFRNQLRTQMLLIKAATKHHHASQSQITRSYHQYTPTMNTSIIVSSSRSNAENVLNDLRNNHADFASLAKRRSIDKVSAADNGRIPAFDSASNYISSKIIDAAKKLKVGQYTESPVEINSQYFIIRLDSRAKKASMSSYRDILREKIAGDWLNNASDTSRVQQVIGDVLNENNVQIKSNQYPALQNALNQYLVSNRNTSNSTSSGSSSKASSSSKTNSSSSKNSSSSSQRSSSSSSSN
ncbi:peptidylprolyl isomerase [Oenococcus alcoholitolerans]|uniref:peptidylprolyl isomerase n=1 Tax=Oenococcus alcoholitolerans TaxID=931074 RepID=UPI003F71918B